MNTDDQVDFSITKCILTADRFGQRFELNLAPSISEVQIFESMELPYLECKFLLFDSIGINTYVSISGNESIYLKINVADNRNVIEKTFIVTGVEDRVSPNDRNEFLVVNCIEKHAYFSSIHRVSSSYTGNPLNSIKGIFKSLDKEVDDTLSASAPAQSNLRYVSPFQNPLKTAELLRDRISTTNGGPYFTYASLNDDNIHLSEFDLLIGGSSSDRVWNKKFQPYTYSTLQPSIGGIGLDESVNEAMASRFFYIMDFNKHPDAQQGNLELAQIGMFGLEYNVFDTTIGSSPRIDPSPYKSNGNKVISEVFKAFDFVFEKDDVGMLADDTGLFGTRATGLQPLSSYNSKSITQALASQVYDHGVNGYHDESQNDSHYLLKVKNAIIRAFMLHNMYQMRVPGLPYALGNGGVGHLLSVDFPYTGENEGEIDPEKSGNYLIYNAKHTFQMNKEIITEMDVVKITKKNKD